MKKWVVIIGLIVFACGAEDSGNKMDEAAASTAGDVDSDGDGDGDADGNDEVEDGDSAGEGDGSSDDDGNSEDDSDSDNSDGSCPDGSEPHITSAGAICCSDTYPVFCDENDDGYTGGCWTDGVDCETLIFCDEQWYACPEEALSYCSEEDGVSCIYCPEDSEVYETTSGRPVCCSSERPVFCDENDVYSGGCWSEGVDCATITLCEETISACFEDSIPYCVEGDGFSCIPCGSGYTQYETSSGRPICCPEAYPTFCDENNDGYTGGCWAASAGCDSLIYCDDVWGLCLEGAQSSCEDGSIVCENAS